MVQPCGVRNGVQQGGHPLRLQEWDGDKSMKEHIPGAGKKIGCGGFCVVNVYAAICVELCFDGKADFRIILWLYLEYHPPLHF